MISIKQLLRSTIIFLCGFLVIGLLYAGSNKTPDTAYKCKILDIYREGATEKTHAKYITVVKIIEIDKITSISVTPECFYIVQEYKKNSRAIWFDFSVYKIEKLTGKSEPTTPLTALLITSFISVIILGFIYLTKYSNFD